MALTVAIARSVKAAPRRAFSGLSAHRALTSSHAAMMSHMGRASASSVVRSVRRACPAKTTSAMEA